MGFLAGVALVIAFAWLIDTMREIRAGVWRVVNDVDRIKRQMGME